jgi:hypothetical protein
MTAVGPVCDEAADGLLGIKKIQDNWKLEKGDRGNSEKVRVRHNIGYLFLALSYLNPNSCSL